jgi:hypothetical protein
MKSRWFSGNSALQIGALLLKLVACSGIFFMVQIFLLPGRRCPVVPGTFLPRPGLIAVERGQGLLQQAADCLRPRRNALLVPAPILERRQQLLTQRTWMGVPCRVSSMVLFIFASMAVEAANYTEKIRRPKFAYSPRIFFCDYFSRIYRSTKSVT